jgi:hypothetical protein
LSPGRTEEDGDRDGFEIDTASEESSGKLSIVCSGPLWSVAEGEVEVEQLFYVVVPGHFFFWVLARRL